MKTARPALAYAGGGRARFACALVVALSLIAPFTIKPYLRGHARVWAGGAASLAFLAGLWWLSTSGSHLRPRDDRDARRNGRDVCVLAAGLLLLNLATKELSPFMGLVPRRPPTMMAIASVGSLAVLLAYARIRRWNAQACTVVLAGAVALTRLVVWRMSPFKGLSGDMLWNVSRALDALRAGRFPYLDTHPQMPYLPGTLLAYWLPHRLGFDLRWANLVIEVATVFVAMRGVDARPRTAMVPLFMLHPTWAYLGINTQYAPSVLAVVLLARSLTAGGPGMQAVALGFATGTNQMFLAFVPPLALWWLRRGWRAFAYLALGVLVFAGIVTPFVLWNPVQFLRVAYLVRPGVRAAVLEGSLSLWPLVAAAWRPFGKVATLAILAAGALAARSAMSPGALLRVLALTLGAVLLVQPVSFTHYFLPAIALGVSNAIGWARPAVPGPMHLSERVKLVAVGPPAARRGGSSRLETDD